MFSFHRVLTILIEIVIMVTVVDRVSAFVRAAHLVARDHQGGLAVMSYTFQRRHFLLAGSRIRRRRGLLAACSSAPARRRRPFRPQPASRRTVPRHPHRFQPQRQPSSQPRRPRPRQRRRRATSTTKAGRAASTNCRWVSFPSRIRSSSAISSNRCSTTWATLRSLVSQSRYRLPPAMRPWWKRKRNEQVVLVASMAR